MKRIEKTIYEEVKKRCELPTNTYGIGAWDHHIKVVYELAKRYASDYGANLEIVSLAALLHDIASVTNVEFTEEHHIIGATIAEDLLKKEEYPIDKIELIKKCILNHRGSKLKEKISPKQNKIFFIMGSDNFNKMPTWKNYNEIKDKYNYIVIERKDQITATKIRKMIKEKNEKVKKYLSKEVYEYIIKNNLYI